MKLWNTVRRLFRKEQAASSNGKTAYLKLKHSLMLRTLFIAAVTGGIWSFVMVYFIDGILQDEIPELFVGFLGLFHVGRLRAEELYWLIIGDNKLIIVMLLFMIIFLLIIWWGISTMVTYLDDVDESIDKILTESEEPIVLVKQLKPLEEKLNMLKDDLARQKLETIEGEQKKNDLILFLAHDLKTPLTSVIAYLSMLETNPDMSVEERARYTHISLEKAHRLWDLIMEFFEITRFDLQGIVLEKEVINLSMMLEQLADEMYAVMKDKNLTSEVYADEDLIIYGDPDKLARVFENLLRNAVTYSHPNTKISIVAREVGEWIEIVFSNSGNTIPKEKLDKLFEKFYRADDARSSETGGAGLGLAIAKEIVELHDGLISATSDEGETRFIVVLPEKAPEERAAKDQRLEKRIEEAVREEKVKPNVRGVRVTDIGKPHKKAVVEEEENKSEEKTSSEEISVPEIPVPDLSLSEFSDGETEEKNA